MAFNTYFKSSALTPLNFAYTGAFIDDSYYIGSNDNIVYGSHTWIPKTWNNEQYAIQNDNEIFINLNGDAQIESHVDMVLKLKMMLQEEQHYHSILCNILKQTHLIVLYHLVMIR